MLECSCSSGDRSVLALFATSDLDVRHDFVNYQRISLDMISVANRCSVSVNVKLNGILRLRLDGLLFTALRKR